jgi:hypothetical protein
MAEVSSSQSVDSKVNSLREHEKQIKKWLLDVKKRIYELETSYLEDTPLGNIVKGWDIDGRPPIMKLRGQCDEKERCFSNSSYTEKPVQDLGDAQEKKVNTSSLQRTKSLPMAKKVGKKRKVDVVEVWNQPGDY